VALGMNERGHEVLIDLDDWYSQRKIVTGIGVKGWWKHTEFCLRDGHFLAAGAGTKHSRRDGLDNLDHRLALLLCCVFVALCTHHALRMSSHCHEL
jgi:hypothetical protein